MIAVIVAPIRVKNNRLAATTLTRSGERHPRVWADQDVWLPYVDILKMNLDEASSTWLGESAEVTADPPRLSDEQVRDLAHHCLDRGVGAVCVALGERGCVTFFRDGSGGVAEKFVDRIEVEHVVDTTGAGDSFAAGLAYGYLAYRDYVMGLPIREPYSKALIIIGEEEQPGDGFQGALEFAGRWPEPAAFLAEHPPCLQVRDSPLDGGWR